VVVEPELIPAFTDNRVKCPLQRGAGGLADVYEVRPRLVAGVPT
jgi:hypothetical protein